MVERDDALFVKDGVPVKFCFHRSVTQGRGQITRDVERYGGRIVADERNANVLLVDEQEDLAFLRRQYYSSTELYRLSLYVEPRGFVQASIRSGTYRHVGPVKQGMPGRAPGGVRVRVPFTEEDRDHLAYYLATRCPKRDGRMGFNAYKDLERLGQTDDPSWAWAKRHTFHSWREHYKINPRVMDARIDHYLQRLKGIGHHFGHDPRSHDRRNLRRELAEEEEEDEDEDEDEDEEQWQGIERQQVHPAGAAPRRPLQAARDYLARHEQDLVAFDDEESDDETQEEEEEEEEEVASQEPQHVKRNRVRPDAHRRRDFQETQAKKARVSEVLSNERRTSGVDAGRGESSSAREKDTDVEESLEIEGSDLFGDRAFEDGSRFDFDDQGFEFPMPFSPRTSPVPEQDGPPLSTQATLIASPRFAEKQLAPAPVPRPTEAARAPAQTPPPTFPPSSQQTLVLTEERVVVQRAQVRGASAHPGPSMPRERLSRTQGGIANVDAPYRDTRARSRSVEPHSQPPRQREDRGGRGKGKTKEDALVEEDMGLEEMAVEGLLEASVRTEADEDNGNEVGEHDEVDGSSDGDIMAELPRFQVVEIGSEPSDSDDAETHRSLVRDVVREKSAGAGDVGGESGSEQEDEDDADRVERMASGKLQATPAPMLPQPRATRSKLAAQTRTQFSPRRTRSGNHPRAAPPFPSPGTKARAVVNRIQEEERRMPYAPPPGSRAARVVKGRGRQR